MYIKNIITNKNCKVFKKVHFAMVLAVSIKKIEPNIGRPFRTKTFDIQQI